MRNGAWNNEKPSWENTLENINQDSSSIYLTSTQQLPISASSTNDYASYYENSFPSTPTKPNLYSGSQVIINSGRLFFNSKEDHILLSSKKTINLNSKEGLFFDTIGNTVFQSDKIYLGAKADQPLLKGNITEALLNSIISYIQALNVALGAAANVGGPVASLQAFAGSPDTVTKLKELNTKGIKSTQNFTI